MTTLAIAILSICFSVAAQFLLRSAAKEIKYEGTSSIYMALIDWRILAGYASYSIAAVIWLRVLNDWDVSKAYPMMGLGFVFSLLVGFLYGEVISATRIVGVAVILIGVTLIAKS